MYKSDDYLDDYLRIANDCAERVRTLLQARYNELENQREAINDRYPFEDLHLKQTEVDDEESLIQKLMEHLNTCVRELEEYHKSDFCAPSDNS